MTYNVFGGTLNLAQLNSIQNDQTSTSIIQYIRRSNVSTGRECRLS